MTEQEFRDLFLKNLIKEELVEFFNSQQKEIEILADALSLAVEELEDAKDMLRECGKKEWASLLNTSVDYFKAKSKEIVDNDTSI